jgi:hypothetical protein
LEDEDVVSAIEVSDAEELEAGVGDVTAGGVAVGEGGGDGELVGGTGGDDGEGANDGVSATPWEPEGSGSDAAWAVTSEDETTAAKTSVRVRAGRMVDLRLGRGGTRTTGTRSGVDGLDLETLVCM